jgi:hypothetical protein
MQRKAAAEAARLARLNKQPRRLASQGKRVDDSPLLQVRTAASRARAVGRQPASQPGSPHPSLPAGSPPLSVLVATSKRLLAR